MYGYKSPVEEPGRRYYRKIRMVDELGDGDKYPWMDFYFEDHGMLFIYASSPLWTIAECLSNLWTK